MADVGIITSGVGFRVYADAVEIPVTATGQVSWSGNSLVLAAFTGAYIDIFFDAPQDLTLTISGYTAATYNTGDKATFTANPDGFPSPWTQSSTSGFVETEGSANPVQQLRFYVGNGGVNLTSLTMAIEVDITEDAQSVSYNCDCEDGFETRTLEQLRTRLKRLIGYAANLTAAPGFDALMNDYLEMAQVHLHEQFAIFKTERFFRWEMEEGVRYYDLDDNADSCGRKLMPTKISWAGVQEDDQWTPLTYGIRPEFYNSTVSGRPEFYEVRQCIEVWPAPDSDDYVLRIKGHFGLRQFTADTDTSTIDWLCILYQAVLLAKAGQEDQDATLYRTLLEERIGHLVAGSHQTRRYIPGCEPAPAQAKPIFLPVA